MHPLGSFQIYALLHGLFDMLRSNSAHIAYITFHGQFGLMRYNV